MAAEIETARRLEEMVAGEMLMLLARDVARIGLPDRGWSRHTPPLMPTRPPTHRPIRYTVPQPSGKEDNRIRGRAHQTRRDRLYRRHPLCVMCEREEGRVTEAVEWDHIIPLWEGGLDVEANLQGLCRLHHLAKSRGEYKRRAAVKRAQRAATEFA